MLLPEKHIRISESILGLGGFVLSSLDHPKTVDTVWEELQKARSLGEFPSYHSFENLVLAVDFLFAIGTVITLQNGKLTKCD